LRRGGRLDAMTVRVERRTESDPNAAAQAALALTATIKDTIGVSLDVEVVEPDQIERSAGKMRRIIDERALTL
jgi:phenylacetate-CoA ligase